HLDDAVDVDVVGGATDAGDAIRNLHFIPGSGGHLLNAAENVSSLKVELGFAHFVGAGFGNRQRINSHAGVVPDTNHVLARGRLIGEHGAHVQARLGHFAAAHDQINLGVGCGFNDGARANGHVALERLPVATADLVTGLSFDTGNLGFNLFGFCHNAG